MPRRLNKERSHAISDEVDRLLQASFIRETFYPDWVSDPVLVKKKNGKWRVCIDFTNLNEACPKDSYPPQLVEEMAGHEHLSFMDVNSGYNQIKMHPQDEHKTAFTTGRGIYCFGLKNVGLPLSEWLTKSLRT